MPRSRQAKQACPAAALAALPLFGSHVALLHQSQHQHVELPHDLPDEAPELTAEDEALVDEYDFSFLDTMDREALNR